MLNKGIFTSDEAERVRVVMGEYTLVVYDHYGKKFRRVPGVMAVRELLPILVAKRDYLAQRGVPVHNESVDGFFKYIGLPNNEWFHLLADERVVLKLLFNGDIKNIEPLLPVTDMRAAIQLALDQIGPQNTVTPAMVWYALEQLGYFITHAQRFQFEACMDAIPGTEKTSGKLYSYHSAEAAARQQQQDLEAKIAAAGLRGKKQPFRRE